MLAQKINDLPRPLQAYGRDELPATMREDPDYLELYRRAIWKHRSDPGSLSAQEWTIARNAPIENVTINLRRVRHTPTNTTRLMQVPANPSAAWLRTWEVCGTE